jgi:hypothetical protein
VELAQAFMDYALQNGGTSWTFHQVRNVVTNAIKGGVDIPRLKKAMAVCHSSGKGMSSATLSWALAKVDGRTDITARHRWQEANDATRARGEMVDEYMKGKGMTVWDAMREGVIQ